MDSHRPYREVQLHKDFKKTAIKVFCPPQPGHAYIIGADPSLGTASDYHAMSVFDITNAYDIRQVASFYENEIPAKLFAYMLAKVGALYNGAFVAIENNGSSQVTLDALWRDYDYDSIICEGGSAKSRRRDNVDAHEEVAGVHLREAASSRTRSGGSR